MPPFEHSVGLTKISFKKAVYSKKTRFVKPFSRNRKSKLCFHPSRQTDKMHNNSVRLQTWYWSPSRPENLRGRKHLTRTGKSVCRTPLQLSHTILTYNFDQTHIYHSPKMVVTFLGLKAELDL